MSSAAPSAEQTLRDAIKRHWGYADFRPLQRESMLAAMQGQDSLTVLPTGGGKSLCYQTPAICRDGIAVVVSPLIALMKDQVDALTENGISAACVNSSLTTQQRMDVAAKVRNKELKLLFVAPERLVQPRTIDFLQDADVTFFAIDEAHCISNWGHDFRPEYRKLSLLRSSFPEASIHAFTATATERVRKDIIQQLSLRSPTVHVGNFDRPNLFYRVERRYDATTQIREVIDRHPKESGIVYCISRAKVDETAATLKSYGYSAMPYHAGLTSEKRKQHQDAFIDEKTDIIVATVAFGMGIDKSNVRYVIHAEMPSSVEAYQQESGRAGRDGLEADCVLLYSGRDISTWEFLIEQSENADNRAASLSALKKMEAFCFSTACRHRQLVQHFGQKLEADNCGACDVCKREVDLVADPLVTAQKVLSGVYRLEQSFGAEYTAQVLRGSKGKRILSNGHDHLSTYGLLKDEPADVVRGWIDQLISQGFLQRVGEHNVLRITQDGGQVLKGEITPSLSRPRNRTRITGPAESWEGVDKGLFEDLRLLRRELAESRGVPPYIILGDMSLRELARQRPSDIRSLTRIYGVGEQKKHEFGQTIVDRIVAYCNENDVSTDIVPAPTSPAPSPDSSRRRKSKGSRTSQYFELFDQGLTRDEVALQLDKSSGTVATYLEQYLIARNISDASIWVSADRVIQIEEAIDEVGMERLKPIFEFLDGEIDYDDIRLVATCRRIGISKQK